jgi:transposase-like protein
MYVETIYKCWCPACDAVNYVNNGNEQDCTVADRGGFVCHLCGQTIRFEEEPPDITDDDTGYIVPGLPSLP